MPLLVAMGGDRAGIFTLKAEREGAFEPKILR